MKTHRLAALALAIAALAAGGAGAATVPQHKTTPAAPQRDDQASATAARDAELFYEVFLGELTTGGGDPGSGYALILDAARKSNDPQLYQRAVEIAWQAHSGEPALAAAQAWRNAEPASREANRALLQVLVALNRIAESAEPLKRELAATPVVNKPATLAAIPQLYARAPDNKLAAGIVEQAIAADLASPVTGPAAWTTVGRMRLAAGDAAGALEAANRAQALEPAFEGPAMLGLELLEAGNKDGDALVARYLQGKPLPELRLAYARVLIDIGRYPEATQQLQVVTAEKPDNAEAWLVQGTLQAQNNDVAAAEASLQRYIALAQAGGANQATRDRGLQQAYLLMAQLAEKRRDFAAAEGWLARIDNAEELFAAQTRRASILASQGRLPEARELIRKLPARNQAEQRMKLTAEVQLLRDAKDYQGAYALLEKAAQQSPDDADLLYDQAMLAEKLGNLGKMEELLRTLIARRPDYHHAYNALGYSLADRGQRLPEARELIRKALEYAPGDPFISDSLGWVEFRLGNLPEALRILGEAYKARPDPEIGAHYGEVLWTAGQRDEATKVWREAQQQDAANETLQSTLRRLKVKL
ncbi:tetratricopeptide repeat protein [Xylophilus sp.]|uniref:tetratricopeptide repeat protein n=1 Tax=Xylophilus sp. TaxID=2653893 RepID=UPI002D7F4602|nr:tetratricopeptide repeat protein [Xylophilus sp.]